MNLPFCFETGHCVDKYDAVFIITLPFNLTLHLHLAVRNSYTGKTVLLTLQGYFI